MGGTRNSVMAACQLIEKQSELNRKNIFITHYVGTAEEFYVGVGETEIPVVWI